MLQGSGTIAGFVYSPLGLHGFGSELDRPRRAMRTLLPANLKDLMTLKKQGLYTLACTMSPYTIFEPLFRP